MRALITGFSRIKNGYPYFFGNTVRNPDQDGYEVIVRDKAKAQEIQATLNTGEPYEGEFYGDDLIPINSLARYARVWGESDEYDED